jgi:RimJ/RimL family protein N-acetyltransferase
MNVIRFRPLEEADLPMFHGWLQRPHVQRWWDGVPTMDELRQDYLPTHTQPDGTLAFIAMQGQRPIGFIQRYVVIAEKGSGSGWWEDETDPGARGVDQFLADAADVGTGLGSAMVRRFVGQLFEDPAVTVVQTDPSPANIRAVRAYLRAGFHAQRLITTPDGPALLMRCWR